MKMASPATVEMRDTRTAGHVIQLLFAGIVGANILSMSLMSFFEVPVRNVWIVYLGCFAVLVSAMYLRLPQLPRLSRRQHTFCIAFALAIFMPRFAYLIEDLLGYAVNFVCYDDRFQLQALASLVHSPKFPPQSSYDSGQYLSYYYAPWMLGSTLYWIGLATTIKQAFALTALIYSLFFAYAVMFASRLLFSDRRQQTAFLIVCLLYGGFDFLYWLWGLTFVPSHQEWWALDFGFVLVYSNSITLMLWVRQHCLSALAILYGLFLLSRSESRVVQGVGGLLFASALFSSYFVVLGAAPIVIWYFLRHKLWSAVPTIVATSVLVCLPLIWMVLDRTDSLAFGAFSALLPVWQEHKRAAFLVFLLIVSLELMPLLVAAFVSVRHEADRSRLVLFGLCCLFLLSNFFVGFAYGNNYVMRGAIVPILALTYLASPALSRWFAKPRPLLLRALAVAYLAGGMLEYASFWRGSLESLAQSQTDFHEKVLRFNQGDPRVSASALAAEAEALTEDHWYLLERPHPRKHTLKLDDVAMMNADNRYRLTFSSAWSATR